MHEVQSDLEKESARLEGEPTDWHGHVIVCGLSDIGLRAVEQLRAIGVPVVVLDDEAGRLHRRLLAEWGIVELPRGARLDIALQTAGLAGAEAVICAENSDLETLEAALLVRDLREDVRVVVHLDNPAVGRAVKETTGKGSVLDVAGLFAPAVVDQCAGRNDQDLFIAGTNFMALEVPATASGRLRELYGDLAPVGVVRNDDGALIVCPGRDLEVLPDDLVTLVGTKEELRGAGLQVDHVAPSQRNKFWGQIAHAARRLADVTDKAIRITLVIGLIGWAVSAVILRIGYRGPEGEHMSWLEAIYFSVETAATVGFGDFSFAAQSDPMQVFAIALIGGGTIIVSLLFALLTNALISARIEQSLGRGRLRGIKHHAVLVGLGAVGMRVIEDLVAEDREVVAIERDEDNRYISQARALGVPVVIGDATLEQTLIEARVPVARAVAVMTSDDMINLETGLAARGLLAERWRDVPVVLRVFERNLGRRLQQRFGFRHVWSTAALAAPWFVGAAIGFGVLATFYVGNVPFLVARIDIRSGMGLDGLPMHELSADTRVVAIERASGSGLEHPPRRDTRLNTGDVAYVAGPADELLKLIKQARSPRS